MSKAEPEEETAPPMHPALRKLIYGRAPYSDGIMSRRDKPLWQLEEEGLVNSAPVSRTNGGFVDVPMRDRPTMSGAHMAQKGGVVDWSSMR